MTEKERSPSTWNIQSRVRWSQEPRTFLMLSKGVWEPTYLSLPRHCSREPGLKAAPRQGCRPLRQWLNSPYQIAWIAFWHGSQLILIYRMQRCIACTFYMCTMCQMMCCDYSQNYLMNLINSNLLKHCCVKAQYFK